MSLTLAPQPAAQTAGQPAGNARDAATSAHLDALWQPGESTDLVWYVVPAPARRTAHVPVAA